MTEFRVPNAQKIFDKVFEKDLDLLERIKVIPRVSNYNIYAVL